MPSLVELIYEAVVEPEGWRTVVQAMGDEFCANNVAITGFNSATGIADAVDTRRDTYYLDSFEAYWAKRNFLWNATLGMPVGSIFLFDTFISRDELKRVPIYAEWFQPQKLQLVLGAHLVTEGPWSVAVTLYRAETQPDFDAAAIARFEALLPHLQRAAQLRARLDGAQLGQADFRNMLDALDRAAVLVDRESRVTFANRAADRLFNDQLLSISRERQLSIVDPVQSRVLRRAIAECLDGDAPGAGASLAIRRPHGRPVTMLVSQLPPSRSVFAAPMALVLIDDPDHPSSAACRCDLLREAYGLTRAEIRLATALLDGRRLRDAADELGITFATARTHLARIFQKASVGSQAELIRLLFRSGFD